MGRSRMFGDDRPEAEGRTPSPRTTIVGGQPPGEDRTLPPVPIGLERLLRLASIDGAFLEVLLERRAGAAAAAGVELTASEAAILGAIPEAQLRAMARQVPPPPAPRRRFLQQAAASAVIALGGASLLSACDGCSPTVTRGATADMPPDRPQRNEMLEDGGAAPDMPPPRPEHNDMMSEGGADPGLPPERPNHSVTQPLGGALAEPPPERPEHRGMETTGGAEPSMPPERKP